LFAHNGDLLFEAYPVAVIIKMFEFQYPVRMGIGELLIDYDPLTAVLSTKVSLSTGTIQLNHG
jgi:hypothetical protein